MAIRMTTAQSKPNAPFRFVTAAREAKKLRRSHSKAANQVSSLAVKIVKIGFPFQVDFFFSHVGADGAVWLPSVTVLSLAPPLSPQRIGNDPSPLKNNKVGTFSS